MNLLVLAIFTPLAAAVALMAAERAGRAVIRWLALAATLVTLGLAAAAMFQAVSTNFAQPALDLPWLSASQLEIRFSLGLDGLGLWMFGLSALLMVTAVLVSWEAIVERPGLFYGMLLLLECGCLGVFAARDVILFYVFFEFTLVPLFFLIGIWGSEQRKYAATKFFVFTLAGSVLTFLGLLAIVVLNAQSTGGTLAFSIPELTKSLAQHPLPGAWQVWIFLALFVGFAIKVPLFPLHTWLPLAHVQAPTAGSVILAGILLKMGSYGFLRFSIPLLPEAAAACAPAMLCLAVVGILYGALVALAQHDIKRLIAYSSVSHMGFCLLGLFAFNRLGAQGGVLQMINHGVSTGALFALVGMLYERYHTREIKQLGGLAREVPILALFMLLFTLSSIGLPGTNGFAGEFLILVGMFQSAWDMPAGANVTQFTLAVLSVLGVVLGAWYMLWLYQRVFFGPLKSPGHASAEAGGGGESLHAAQAGRGSHEASGSHAASDLSPREIAALLPLAVFVFWIGLAPNFFLQPMALDVNRAVQPAAAAPKPASAPGEGLARVR